MSKKLVKNEQAIDLVINRWRSDVLCAMRVLLSSILLRTKCSMGLSSRKSLRCHQHLLSPTYFSPRIDQDKGSLHQEQPYTIHEELLLSHLPFGSREAYKEEIANASLEKLARLVKICGLLMQTKVYFFWRV